MTVHIKPDHNTVEFPDVPDVPPYDEKTFWTSVKGTAKSMGTTLLVPALTLYHAMLDERTPIWAKTIVASALAYLVFPADAIPDILPVVGFSDDLGAIFAAFGMVTLHIKKEHKSKAVEQVEEILG